MSGLRAEQLGIVRQNVPLLQDISLSVTAGELHVLLGPNGAGKSTLLRALAGEWPPQSGRLLLDGLPLQAHDTLAQARRRAVLPQYDALSFSLGVRELVTLGRHPCKDQRTATTHEVVDAVMEATHTSVLAARRYPTLSGGERRRVQLARVLAQVWDAPAPILLLDEPTHSLDLVHQHAVLALLHGLARKGFAILISLHDLNLASSHADQVSLMRGGRMLATGAAASVLDEARLQALYGEGLRFHAVAHEGATQWLSSQTRRQ
ncbi:MAG: heme ABC transporter ATP-binding protein [Pseudomonadota bacterium]